MVITEQQRQLHVDVVWSGPAVIILSSGYYARPTDTTSYTARGSFPSLACFPAQR